MSKITMPEPVVVVGDTFHPYWFGAKTIADIAKESGVKVGDFLITTNQAEAYAAAKVREALEEAAEIADRMNAFPVYDAIRALIPKEKK